MSKTEKIQAQIKKLNEELKQAKEIEKPFYIVDAKGIVLMKRAEHFPKSCAYWEGESGAKTLKIEGDFKERVLSHANLKGYNCVRIKPLLKELGYKYNPKGKTWDRPIVEAPVETADVKDGNPLV
jgi:hypothetical protein